mmetsp:Transcript_42310/g.79225  ORF Transcript_42310/g.79225 Transcript_42310/m.79225 type:complete len:505 (+) Transcript_42310:167-1681(+)
MASELHKSVSDPRKKLLTSLQSAGLLSGEAQRKRQVQDLKDYPDIAALASVAKTKENFYEIMGSPKLGALLSPVSVSTTASSTTNSSGSPELLPKTESADQPQMGSFHLDGASLPEQAGPDLDLENLSSLHKVPTERTDFLWNLAGNGSPCLRPLDSPDIDPDATQKSGVYLLESPKVGPVDGPYNGRPFQSIFKPLDEEGFDRRGIELGMGALREEAAFVIDRVTGSQACVPVTARASLEEGGVRKKGSVQQFVEGSVGPVENFGMPRELQAAEEFVALDDAQAVACFDIRIFNTDRHSGNLLLAGPRPHRIVCIDHGCVLPAWWALDRADFDAWLEWPHVKAPNSPSTMALITSIVNTLPRVVLELEKLGLPRQAIWTLEICTSLLEKGVLEHGLSLHSIALLMTRMDPAEPSWLELKIHEACLAAGAVAEFQPEGKYGDLMFQLDPKLMKQFEAGGAALESKHFHHFRSVFFGSLNDAFSHPNVCRDVSAVEDLNRPPWDD